MAWHDCYGKQVTKGLNSYHYIAISVYLTLMATLLHHTCIASHKADIHIHIYF